MNIYVYIHTYLIYIYNVWYTVNAAYILAFICYFTFTGHSCLFVMGIFSLKFKRQESSNQSFLSVEVFRSGW